MITQLDRIEKMLTELVRVSRKERAAKRQDQLEREMVNYSWNESFEEDFEKNERANKKEIANILKFGGDIN